MKIGCVYVQIYLKSQKPNTFLTNHFMASGRYSGKIPFQKQSKPRNRWAFNASRVLASPDPQAWAGLWPSLAWARNFLDRQTLFPIIHLSGMWAVLGHIRALLNKKPRHRKRADSGSSNSKQAAARDGRSRERRGSRKCAGKQRLLFLRVGREFESILPREVLFFFFKFSFQGFIQC